MHTRLFQTAKDHLSEPYNQFRKLAKEKTDLAYQAVIGRIPDSVYHFYLDNQAQLPSSLDTLQIVNSALALLVLRGMFVNTEVHLDEYLGDIAAHVLQALVDELASEEFKAVASTASGLRILDIVGHTLSWNSSIPLLTNLVDLGLHSVNIYNNATMPTAAAYAAQKKSARLSFTTRTVAEKKESVDLTGSEEKEEKVSVRQTRKVL